VGDDRTDREDVKRKFLFSNDVPSDCSIWSQLVSFFSGAPTVGPAIAHASGRISNDVSDVIYRRSVLKRYDFQSATATTRFVSTSFAQLPAQSCFTIYAVDVFGTSNSFPIGTGCLD